MDKAHGRQEIRRLTSTTCLNEYLDWPGVKQVFELERVRVVGEESEVEVVCGLTSVGRERADAGRLLEWGRGHWGIENKLHWVRDETLGEDRCRVRTGSAPQVLAALRNVAVNLLEGVQAASKAAATRRFMIHPQEALPFLLG